MEQTQSIKEILDTYGKYTGLTMGTSMEPLIHEQQDNIMGKYIMHRVVKVCDDHYVIVGDNLLKKEYVTDDMICGVLVGFYKKGKKYIDCTSSKKYMIYSKIWVALLPIRPAILLFPRGVNWIKRHIFKKG